MEAVRCRLSPPGWRPELEAPERPADYRPRGSSRAPGAAQPGLDRDLGWVLSRSANSQPSQRIAPRRRLLARTYRQLDLDQRRTLFRLVEARTPVGEIAARLGRHPSTIYRELGRNRF